MEKCNLSQEVEIKAKENMEKRGYPEKIPSFNDVTAKDIEIAVDEDKAKFGDLEIKLSDEELARAISTLNISYTIGYGNIKDKGIKKFIKRVIRYMVSFLILPVIEQQTNFNANVTQAINQLTGRAISDSKSGSGKVKIGMREDKILKYFDDQEKHTEELENEILLLKKEINDLKSK